MPSPPPGKTPRRSKPSLLARLGRYWIVGSLAAVLLVFAGRMAARAAMFDTRLPEVAGNLRVPAAEILAAARLDPQSNVWLVDARAVEGRIEAIPYVASAHLVRGFPGGARIEISERKAEACIRSEVATVTIDSAQRVLQTGCAARVIYRTRATTEFTVGEFLHDASIARLQSDARTLASTGRRLSDFTLDEYGRLEAALPGGVVVRFGDDDDLAAKERLIGPILATLGARVATVSAIDLRAPATPVVEHKHGTERDSKTYPQSTDIL